MREAGRRDTVVITGASAGVGRATAVEFARHGFRVGLIARGAEGLAGAAQDVHDAGGVPLVLPADVADAEAVQSAADRVVKEWGRIDVWVNCAMATMYARVHEMSPAEFRRITEVSYLGYVYGTLAALSDMRRRGDGTIVQVGSALAHRAIPLQSAYCAAKFATRGFTEALRSELFHERSRIRLSMVQLPAINTPQFDWARNRMPSRPKPVAPIYQPETAARAIYEAAKTGPRELWVGRSTIQAILADLVAPGLLDRLLARTATRGQMANEPSVPNAPDNLFEPFMRDFGAHGRFDSESTYRAVSVSSSAARTALGLAAVGIFAGAFSYLLSRSNGRRSAQPVRLLKHLTPRARHSRRLELF